MILEGLELFKLEQLTDIKPFDCKDEDLRDFLFSKAKQFQKELLGITYILEDEDKTIAYFSIFNDSLNIQESNFASKSAFKRFLQNLVTHPKRHLKNFPALKIGRLAVCNDLQKGGIGKAIVNYVIDIALEHNLKAACKLIIVDAYEESVGFYEKQGFSYLSESDAHSDTRQMYFDLTLLASEALKEAEEVN